MATLSEMFEPYLKDQFPERTEFVDDGGTRLRITAPRRGVGGYPRAVVVEVDRNMMEELAATWDSGNIARQDRYGDKLSDLVHRLMQESYDPDDDPATAFKIYIDNRLADDR